MRENQRGLGRAQVVPPSNAGVGMVIKEDSAGKHSVRARKRMERDRERERERERVI